MRPVQERLQIMIGGGGEQRTLRTTARYADMWHGFGTADLIKHKLEVLRQHCADVGRDPNEIVPYGGSWLVIRDDKDEAERVLANIAKHHPGMNRPNAFVGNTEEVTKHLKSFWDSACVDGSRDRVPLRPESMSCWRRTFGLVSRSGRGPPLNTRGRRTHPPWTRARSLTCSRTRRSSRLSDNASASSSRHGCARSTSSATR